MTAKKMTRRERLRSMIEEAEPNSVLKQELVAVRDILAKPKEQALPLLLRFLKPSLQSETKWMIGWTLETFKDERIIRPMMRALLAPENANRSNYFLWPLTKYDCTPHLWFFVNFIARLKEPGEAMMVTIMIIKAMKGPFDPVIARKSIRTLLAEVKTPMAAEWKEQTEAFRLEAADYIMAKYFNKVSKEFWQPRNGSVPISKTP